MNWIESRAREWGLRELALDFLEKATELIAFYSQRGFRQVGTFQWDSTNYRSVVLSKEIALAK